MGRDRRTAAPSNCISRRRESMADSATLEEQCHQKKIFVGGLAGRATSQTIRDHFKRYGTIVDAVVLRWPDGRSRGFGYITFADTSSATAALKDMHKISGCEVDVKRAVPGTNKIFVGGLPQSTTAAEMRTYFEQFGIVSDAVVMMDPATQRSRGFGFICFAPGHDGTAAVAATLEQYNNHYIRGKWIEVKGAAAPRKLAAEQNIALPEVPAAVQVATSSPSVSHHAEQIASVPTLQATSPIPVSTPVSTIPNLCAPPGLDIPTGLDNFGSLWPQHSQPLWTVERTPNVTPRTELLPSLLGASRKADAAHEPVKVHLGGSYKLKPWAAEEETSQVFDASTELRRSLEELLKLHSQNQMTQTAQ